jgi:hypothetical protein
MISTVKMESLGSEDGCLLYWIPNGWQYVEPSFFFLASMWSHLEHTSK